MFQLIAPKELFNNEFFLDDVLIHSKCDKLITNLIENNSFQEQVNYILKKFLPTLSSGNIYPRKYYNNELFLAILNKINNTNGSLKIESLSDLTGYSTRYINKIFTEYVGVGPKKYANYIRFQHALNLLNHELAQSINGFYDQAHFINNFKEFSSLTPKKYYYLLKADFYSFTQTILYSHILRSILFCTVIVCQYLSTYQHI
ncbi:helix-turn-helix domain-containing protein [Liquorilactobacillus mali]|uniref:helix-turn-helix domain-containing protein n=1 Tax=Liquorilactobacillus mali TaxID=1618 RepID=UPI0039EBEFE4